MRLDSLLQAVAAISKEEIKNIPKSEINDAQFQSLFSTVLAIGGVMAVIFIIIGGIKYATSQGNAGDLEKGKDIIVYALVGLFFVMFGFVIIQFVTGNLF